MKEDLNTYTESIKLFKIVTNVIDKQYNKYKDTGGIDLHPALINYIKEARFLLNAVFSMKVIGDDIDTEQEKKFMQEFKVVFNRLPDFIKTEIKNEFKKRELEITASPTTEKSKTAEKKAK
jgi:hypothetical protein